MELEQKIDAYGFRITETEHKNCQSCLEAAHSAAVTAYATGSVGASQVIDGSRLKAPYYHSGVVKRKPKKPGLSFYRLVDSPIYNRMIEERWNQEAVSCLASYLALKAWYHDRGYDED